MPRIQLGSFEVSDESPPYVIAEIGVNHEGSMEIACELIRLAKQGGAHAAKFQTYKAHKLASRDSPSYWDLTQEEAKSQFQLFRRYDAFDEAEYTALAQYCGEVGIQFLSTPFDDEAVDFLDPLMPFYKVASADLNNVPLLRKVASKRKSVVLSTGASTLGEIDTALDTLEKAGCADVILLHCVLNYPTSDDDAHLGMIRGLRRCFPERVVGYSDHTVPDREMTTLCTAYLLGARVLEKHFTHDKTLAGNDHYHAMDLTDLRHLTERVPHLRRLIGESDHKGPLAGEGTARRNARRSIVLRRAVDAGHVLSAGDLTPKRPGTGISPLNWDEVLGRRTRHALDEDQVLRWEDLATAEGP
jgi:sialic acid synthase SpsE